MTQQIRTRWHKLGPIFDSGSVFVNAVPGQTTTRWTDHGGKLEVAKGFVLNDLNKLPKFFFDDELMEIASSEGYQQSLADLHKAGLCRLPFPGVIVEFNNQFGSRAGEGATARYIVYLRDNAAKDVRFPWENDPAESEAARKFFECDFYGLVLRLSQDAKGEYLVFSPFTVGITLEDRDGQPWLALHANPHDLLPGSKKLSDIIGQVYKYDAAVLWHSMLAAVLLTRTEGVAQEVVDCTKMNRARVKSNKTPIPTHTVLHIGRVYRSASGRESDVYVSRRSPRPHWRCGHFKTVRFGKGREKSREHWVDPRIVSWKEGQPEPAHTNYVVKR